MFKNPSRVAFQIGPRPVYWYGILLASSVLVAMFFAMRSARKYRWKDDDLIDFCLWAVPLGVVFARLYYVVFSWSTYAANPLHILYIWEGGLALYGAALGGVVAAIIFAKQKKRSLITLFDIIAPSFALAQAIGRWGNFFNQEAFGIAVANPALMWFPFAVRIDATNTIHYATFFYESVWCLGIFLFLWFFRKRFTRKGDVGLTYLMLYGFERMFIEALRTDSLMIGTVRVSQLLSALLFVAVVCIFIARKVHAKTHPVHITNALNPAYVWPETEPAANFAEEVVAEDVAAEAVGVKDALSEGESVAEDAGTVAANAEAPTVATESASADDDSLAGGSPEVEP